MATTLQLHDYDSAVDFLFGRINYEQATQIPYRSREFKLQRMEDLLALLDNPHHRFPAVHIAGTKGKGSTAAMTEAILRAAGLHTGMYTSPHLERIEERFAIDGLPCSEAIFVDAVREVEPVIRDLDQQGQQNGEAGPTYFETTTAIAMLIFAQAEVDMAVLEVGLGGRLDSTNVCRPLVSIITSISYDHTQQLGKTLTSIAREKAGIIKPGVPLVSGALHPEAADVIRRGAQQMNAPYAELQRDFGMRDGNAGGLTYWHEDEFDQSTIDDISLAMCGAHQAENAALAIAAVGRLTGFASAITPAAIRTGLSQATCPARVEVLSRHPLVILDAAHNVASCRALVESLEQHFPQCRQRTLILATSNDKDLSGMLEILLPAFDRVVFTRYQNNPRSTDPQKLLSIAQSLLPGEAPAKRLQSAATPAEAISMVELPSSDDQMLCVAGSFFLAGEVRPLLKQRLVQHTSHEEAGAPPLSLR